MRGTDLGRCVRGRCILGDAPPERPREGGVGLEQRGPGKLLKLLFRATEIKDIGCIAVAQETIVRGLNLISSVHHLRFVLGRQ